MRCHAELTIDGVTVTNYLGYLLVGYDQVKIAIQNSTIMRAGWAQASAARQRPARSI